MHLTPKAASLPRSSVIRERWERVAIMQFYAFEGGSNQSAEIG